MTKIIRTPYRVSLFGGGTDFPQWFTQHGGMTISFTINKYSYLTITDRPKFAKPKYRISYSKIENVENVSEIKHPLFRSYLENYTGYNPITIHHEGDLPGMSGIGSSSALSVGLMTYLYPFDSNEALRSVPVESIRLERTYCNEPGGWQDQYACAYGGFNQITYSKFSTEVNPIPLEKRQIEHLENHMFLIWTGIQRKGHLIEKQKVKDMTDNVGYYKRIQEITKNAYKKIENGDFDLLPIFLRQMSETKEEIYNSLLVKAELCRIKNIAFENGAEAIKILGAGGGGFMLCWAAPEHHKAIADALHPLECVHFKLEFEGSKVIYEDNGGW